MTDKSPHLLLLRRHEQLNPETGRQHHPAVPKRRQKHSVFEVEKALAVIKQRRIDFQLLSGEVTENRKERRRRSGQQELLCGIADDVIHEQTGKGILVRLYRRGHGIAAGIVHSGCCRR